MSDHIAVCETVDCPNGGVEMVLVDPAPLVYCAICAQQVTNITPPVLEDPALSTGREEQL